MSNSITWMGTDWGQTDAHLEWVELTPEQCERAYAFSRSGDRTSDGATVQSSDETIGGGSDRTWVRYHQALALIGFKAWLHQRAPDIGCNIESLLSGSFASNPSVAPWLAGTVTISVGDFQVCLLPAPSGSDDQVAVPSGVIESSQGVCHFYVWIAVSLEFEQVAVRSFQHYGALHQACTSITPGLDNVYWVDEEVFDPNPDQLLLQLKCLAPEAIPLPGPMVNPMASGEPPVSQVNAPFSTASSSVPPLGPPTEPQIPWDIQLSSWLQGTIDVGWQTLEALFSSASLQYEWRVSADSSVAPIVRGKRIEALPLPSDQSIVLLVEVLPSADPSETNLSITLKVSSADGQQFLPASLELVVLDEVGEAVMQVQARDENRMLELGFYAARGDRFSVRLNLHDTMVDEYFTV